MERLPQALGADYFKLDDRSTEDLLEQESPLFRSDICTGPIERANIEQTMNVLFTK